MQRLAYFVYLERSKLDASKPKAWTNGKWVQGRGQQKRFLASARHDNQEIQIRMDLQLQLPAQAGDIKPRKHSGLRAFLLIIASVNKVRLSGFRACQIGPVPEPAEEG